MLLTWRETSALVWSAEGKLRTDRLVSVWTHNFCQLHLSREALMFLCLQLRLSHRVLLVFTVTPLPGRAYITMCVCVCWWTMYVHVCVCVTCVSVCLACTMDSEGSSVRRSFQRAQHGRHTAYFCHTEQMDTEVQPTSPQSEHTTLPPPSSLLPPSPPPLLPSFPFTPVLLSSPSLLLPALNYWWWVKSDVVNFATIHQIGLRFSPRGPPMGRRCLTTHF